MEADERLDLQEGMKSNGKCKYVGKFGRSFSVSLLYVFVYVIALKTIDEGKINNYILWIL